MSTARRMGSHTAFMKVGNDRNCSVGETSHVTGESAPVQTGCGLSVAPRCSPKMRRLESSLNRQGWIINSIDCRPAQGVAHSQAGNHNGIEDRFGLLPFGYRG